MRHITVLLAMASLTACAAPRDSHIDPAGPYPDVRAGNFMREETDHGVLVVYTSRMRVNQEGRWSGQSDGLDWDSSHSVYTGYTIYDQSGHLWKEVPNHSPLVISDERPSDVALAAGRYLVRLDRAQGEVQTFWVTIEARRRTEVDPARLVPRGPGRLEGPELR